MIPPRPWSTRAAWRDYGLDTIEGESVIVDARSPIPYAVNLRDRDVAALIVRLVNAEPDVVAALQSAEAVLGSVVRERDGRNCNTKRLRSLLDQVRAALALVRE